MTLKKGSHCGPDNRSDRQCNPSLNVTDNQYDRLS